MRTTSSVDDWAKTVVWVGSAENIVTSALVNVRIFALVSEMRNAQKRWYVGIILVAQLVVFISWILMLYVMIEVLP